MLKRGISGRMLTITSLLDHNDRLALANNIMIRTSSSVKEATKIGLQSLYANADKVLEKYKDFDIIKEMKSRKDSNLLWVRARAIDADVVNTNGDYFSEEELTKEVEIQGKKIPAYKTFEGVPIYTNHKNDDIEEAKGMVVYAEWDDDEKCVYCVFFIDEDAYPELARAIRLGYVHDVSMGASVDLGICSICGNQATTEKDYCFAPGTLITLSDGSLKPIEDIQTGDNVLTHLGRSKSVQKLSINYINETILKINSAAQFHPLIVTNNHPFFGIKNNNLLCHRDKRQICRPGEIGICFGGQKTNIGNQTCFSNELNINPSFIHSGCLSEGDYIQALTPKFNISTLGLSPDFAAFIGYYMAEGCLPKIGHRIALAFNTNELDNIVCDLEKACMGIDKKYQSKYKPTIRTKDNHLDWRWTNSKLKGFIKNHCLGLATTKKLSEELFQNICSDKNLAKAFLGAFIDGDGCQSINQSEIQIRTASTNLASQLVMIFATLGIRTPMFLQKQGGGPTNRLKECYIWHVTVNGFDSKHFIGSTRKVSSSANRQTKRSLNNEFGFATPITKIDNISYSGPVYNFSVKDDESYIANGVIVHNCACLQQYKGRNHPSGKKTFEYNYGIKFIELSCVGDGAFESCEIMEIYDQEELFEKAKVVIKSAQSLNSSVILASAIYEDDQNRQPIDVVLRQLQDINYNCIKIAQTAGTLVGGQILGSGTVQNATVVKILQGLGIDPSSNLNILDLVNLALNFLEVAVLNLFSRKDNIDLSHVAKLTKAMGELQNTLQDMIDDGIETGSKGQAPMVPPQPGAEAPQPQQTPQMPPQTPTQATNMDFSFEPSVGQLISPLSQPSVMPLGGGITADTNNHRIVWASSNYSEDEPIKKEKLNKLGRFAVALDQLREACGVSVKNPDEVIIIPSQKNNTASSGDKNIMDHFKKIAQDLKKAQQAALSIDIKLDDQEGNRVILSTDKGIKGFHNGKLTKWVPGLTDIQIAQMENGDGYRVAADLLKDFSTVIKKAEAENKVDFLVVMDESLDQCREDNPTHIISNLKDHHKGFQEETMQQRLENGRKNNTEDITMNELLGKERKSELVHIITELSNAAKKALGDTPLELMLHPEMKRSKVAGKKVMNSVVKSITKTCSTTDVKPEAVIKFLTEASSNKDFAKLLKLARLGTKSREYDYLLKKFAQIDEMADKPEEPKIPKLPEAPDMPDAEMEDGPSEDMPMEGKAIEDIADTVEPETTEGDIISALNVIKDNFEEAVKKLDEIINKNQGEDNDLDDMKDGLMGDEDEEDIDKDSMKGAVTGLSLSGEDTESDPSQLVDTVNDMPSDDMAEKIDFARKPQSVLSRTTNRNIKKASTKNLSENIVGWLADVANHENIPTEKITLAAKLFCSYKEAAVNILKKSIKTSEIRVTDETTHTTTIFGTIDDIGIDVKDAAFNDKFRDFAVNLLSGSGYEVDPMTFSLTDIEVSEDGMVCGKVSTRALKTFVPDEITGETEAVPGDYIDQDRAAKEFPQEPMIEGSIDVSPAAPNPTDIMPAEEIVMSDSAKSLKRLARLQNVVKIAQGLGLPGAAAPSAPIAGPTPQAPAGDAMAQDPSGMAGGMADLGLSSLTGATPAEGEENINDSPEPGNKAPWGTICPQCGSKDVDVANGEGTCNSCQANLKYKFIVEVAPPEGQVAEEAPMPEEGGLGAAAPAPAEAPVPAEGGAEFPALGAGAGTPPVAGMPTASNLRVMTRIAYKTSADVYANALSNNFNKEASSKLPVGMICPACGSKTASKKSKHTYCYDCNTISVSEIKRVEGEPGVLEANIVWI